MFTNWTLSNGGLTLWDIAGLDQWLIFYIFSAILSNDAMWINGWSSNKLTQMYSRNQTWQWTILYLSMFLLTSMPTMPIDRAFQASNPPPKGPCFVLGLQSPTSLREWQQWLSGTVFCDGDATDLGVPWEVQGTKQWSFNGHRNKASLSGWVWWNMGNSRISQPCWDPGT